MFPKRFLVATFALASVCACQGGGDSGPDAETPTLNYTFDKGSDGWVLTTNLGAGVPDGGSPPSLEFASTDGDPSPGALRLAVAFTGPDQYVSAGVYLTPVEVSPTDYPAGRDLSGKTLHARFRLLGGAASGPVVALFACSFEVVTSFCAPSPSLDVAALNIGTWVPLVMDLDAAAAQYNAFPEVIRSSGIYAIGVEIYTPTTFASTGDLVFEIDTVTD